MNFQTHSLFEMTHVIHTIAHRFYGLAYGNLSTEYNQGKGTIIAIALMPEGTVGLSWEESYKKDPDFFKSISGFLNDFIKCADETVTFDRQVPVFTIQNKEDLLSSLMRFAEKHNLTTMDSPLCEGITAEEKKRHLKNLARTGYRFRAEYPQEFGQLLDEDSMDKIYISRTHFMAAMGFKATCDLPFSPHKLAAMIKAENNIKNSPVAPAPINFPN